MQSPSRQSSSTVIVGFPSEGQRQVEKISAGNQRPENLHKQAAVDTDYSSPLHPELTSNQSDHLEDSRDEWNQLPHGHDLQPYLKSYLANVHPICFQNILHPGVLLEGLERAPKILLLAICGASAKFLSGQDEKANGRRWMAEAKSLIMKDLNDISTLNLVVLQTIALHEVHEANIISAWNLTGKLQSGQILIRQ